MDINGRRELLASDPQILCNPPVPRVPRSPPPPHPTRVENRQNSGTYYVYDVYAGHGLERVPQGVIKKLRVISHRLGKSAEVACTRTWTCRPRSLRCLDRPEV